MTPIYGNAYPFSRIRLPLEGDHFHEVKGLVIEHFGVAQVAQPSVGDEFDILLHEFGVHAMSYRKDSETNSFFDPDCITDEVIPVPGTI